MSEDAARPASAILPRPRAHAPAPGVFPLLSAGTRIEHASHGARAAALRLRDHLLSRHGLSLPVEEASTACDGAILVGMLSDAAVRAALQEAPMPARLENEGYILSVTPRRVVIAASDAAGLFYGAQTLLQMVPERPEEDGVPCGTICDEPVHPFRGVHLYVPPKTEIHYFTRLIEFLASCKVNKIILEIAASVELKRHPEINQAWDVYAAKARKWPFRQSALQNYNTLHGRGKDSNHFEQGGGTFISQDDVRVILDCARENGIEIIPEIPSPGHAYWLCLAHPDIAEWQEDKYPDTICPSNPKSYDLLFDVMDELIALFEPSWVSSGGDEYYFYGICPRCRGRSGGELLAGHLNKVNAFLRARGIRHLAWGDKLINPDELEVKRLKEWGTGAMIKYGGGERVLSDEAGTYRQGETWQAIDLIPDDILIADWYYSLSPDTEKYFATHCKEIIFGNVEPLALANHPERLYAPNVRGGEYSSWIENGEMSLSHMNWPLMAAISADLFWSDHCRRAAPPKRMKEFMSFWNRQRSILMAPEEKLPARRHQSFTTETINLHDASRIRFHGNAMNAAAASAPKAAHAAGPVPFALAAPPVAVPLDDGGCTIRVGCRVRGIVFLWGMNVREEEVRLPPLYEYGDYKDYYLQREVATLTVRAGFAVKDPRQSVQEGRVPIRLGFEIGSLCEPCGMTPISRPTFCDAVLQPDGTALFAYEWANPNPENWVLAEVALARGRGGAKGELLLHAVTLVM